MRKPVIWVGFLVIVLAFTSLSCALFEREEPTPIPLPPTETPEPPTATPTAEEPTLTPIPTLTPSPEPTETPTAESTRKADLEEMVFVESQTHGVRICHPEGWFYDDTFFVVMSSNPEVDLFAEGGEIEDGVVIIAFAGPSDEMGADDSPEMLFEQLTEQFAGGSENVEILSGPDEGVINDIPVMTVDFAATEEGEVARGRIVILDNGEQAAVVIAVSPLDQWDDYGPVVEDIMGCVELFEGTGLGFDIPYDEKTREMGTISVGESVAGSLAEEESHSWALEARGGEIVNILVTPLDDEMDLVVTVLGAGGTMYGYYDDSATDEPEEILGLELDSAGETIIRIEEFWGTAGSYTLEIAPGKEGSGSGAGPAEWTTMGELALGQIVESSLNRGERHAWIVTAEAGDVLDITVNPVDAEMDLTFSVIAPNGSPLVAQYDEGFSGEPEVLYGLRFDWSGDYTVIVGEFWGEAGSYELWVEPGIEGTGDDDVLEMGFLAYGEVGTGTLPAGGNLYHLWSFEGAAGDVISVVVEPQSADADLMLGLLSPDGSILVELVDETGSDEPERIASYKLDVTGTFAIVVTEYWDEYAEYQLTLELD